VKAAALLALVLVYPAWADDATESAEIGRVIGALNNQRNPLSEVLAPDISDIERAYFTPEPWSEVTYPQIDIRSIRLLTDATALVAAESTQFGSVIMKRSESMVLLLRKCGAGWRIACVLAPNLAR
jgi:hypothetical protein